ncbi:MAG: pyruvate, water dikinase regulatory protein [Pseudomonadota bacterium]
MERSLNQNGSHFHLHLISDSTGETIIAAARAVTSQYRSTQPLEHVYPLVRNRKQLDGVIDMIAAEPGIVLFTIADSELSEVLEEKCREMGTPCVSVLEPIFQTFQSYLGKPTKRIVGAQHALDNEYFSRIDALNFTMLHDDGVLPENIEEADLILLGISRTSKTPTSIYLANRGIKTANIPLVPGAELPLAVIDAKHPLIVTLIASTDRIQQVRQNRLLELNAATYSASYADRASIADELAQARKLSKRHGWPLIDVSRKSIEETAAAILALHAKHVSNRKSESSSQ